MSDEAVCRTAPGKSGLSNVQYNHFLNVCHAQATPLESETGEIEISG